jgi:aspartate kinase
MVTTSEVAVSVTIDNNAALSSIKKELEALGSVETDTDQTIISIVGNEIASDATALKKVFDSLNNISVRMVSYGGSDNNISLLVPADQKKQVLQQLNSGVFGLA